MTKLNALAGVVHKSAILNQDGISVNVLHEDVCLPAVVVKRNELENNIAWMQHYSCGECFVVSTR